MKIFLIAGKAGSGKGEVAKYIKEYYIYKHQKVAITEYGKYLKKFAMEIDEWDGNISNKPRKFLQELGRKIRDFNPDYLINNMLQDFNVYDMYVDAVVVADVRMPEEIDKIRNNYDDVYAIHVINQFSESNLSIEEQIDITELALESYDEFDGTIINDNLDTLKDKVFKLLGDE